ncbi:hypothetical protein PtrSN002B_007689 [Pyrenophora tritici-repentis]|uniref:Uncharacterized protein n=2 Tax=Pyrenophora tritici-repentis TaxID=45151 RepID=A0A2W1DQN4_9PLEO|nr:uncharacterized protein PTRG_09822 [Pyrenophora tritici-repentis Pt-1C-BFP]KAA8621806.1 hypothetical protein PtrV1_06307 [Pyrenophora tritici-repentis]EDU42873.1 predicted protein [Pyrenophora tritici-repentis Pt-1C-BFP]KAF7451028.1 hypothetical protein A1F99_056440 [Pyrenophora tritici-repentis]KAF7573707.1 hypothetical protein PtrM4_086120 [Pyrenophora tritici-repentis]KAG9380759.1 hypothetical protein A1F94_008079 [Pyrenophora tritici-repentis]
MSAGCGLALAFTDAAVPPAGDVASSGNAICTNMLVADLQANLALVELCFYKIKAIYVNRSIAEEI